MKRLLFLLFLIIVGMSAMLFSACTPSDSAPDSNPPVTTPSPEDGGGENADGDNNDDSQIGDDEQVGDGNESEEDTEEQIPETPNLNPVPQPSRPEDEDESQWSPWVPSNPFSQK